MKQAERKMILRIGVVLLTLWLIFMLIFSFWQVSAKREALLGDITVIMSAQCENITDHYEEYYGQVSTGKFALTVDPLWDITARFQAQLSAWRKKQNMEMAIYDENWNLMAHGGDYVLVRYELPPLSQGRSCGETHYGVLDIHSFLAEEEAGRLIDYLNFEVPQNLKEGRLVGYDLVLGAFWTDGRTIIPREFAVTEIRADSDSEVDMISASFDAEGNLLEGSEQVVWLWENPAPPEETEDVVLLTSGAWVMQGWPSGMGQLNEEARDWVLNLENVKPYWFESPGSSYDSSGSITAEGFLVTDFYSVWINEAVGQMGVGGNGSLTLAAAGQVYPLRDSLKNIGLVALGSGLLFLLVGTILCVQMEKVLAAQAELEQRRRGMTNAIAHDLKTPMAALLGYSENLLENTRPDKQTHYLQAIQTQTKRMNDSLVKMLEISKMENEAEQTEKTGFLLGPLCREAAEDCFLGEGMYLISGEAGIRADREQLRRCMNNLLSNARRHAEPGSLVTVSLSPGRCEVYNAGAAIPETAMARIWEPYFRVEQERSGGGSGLGLSIVREIMVRHGFDHGVQNREDGVVFWFSFPPERDTMDTVNTPGDHVHRTGRGVEPFAGLKRFLVGHWKGLITGAILLGLVLLAVYIIYNIYVPRPGIIMG